ncbi:hypothetical protein NVP1193O_197 [Vibrio phage 1.193.O._10N.286.52.C6]|nr:hypothetical protein NVP1193O_197 [Vibrio phage 1.193.O._10N.286.52.C6]
MYKPLKHNERRVLLLASYCSDNPDCSNRRPCNKCLSMCNTFNVDKSAINIRENYAGELGEETN